MALDYYGSAAEKAYAKTRVNLELTIVSLAKIVIERCDGSEYLNDVAVAKLRQSLNELLKIRDFIK
jgi:hypothetical protein